MRSMGKLYQIIYYVTKDVSPWEPWWTYPYLLQCPAVGIKGLEAARKRAKEWKEKLGEKFQPIIIGETDTDFESVDCDCLYGITALRGANACEFEFPDMFLEED